jgi:hypothetical protein
MEDTSGRSVPIPSMAYTLDDSFPKMREQIAIWIWYVNSRNLHRAKKTIFPVPI